MLINFVDGGTLFQPSLYRHIDYPHGTFACRSANVDFRRSMGWAGAKNQNLARIKLFITFFDPSFGGQTRK